MGKPDIHVFRSAPQFTRDAEGVEAGSCGRDSEVDSINVRVIDSNIYFALRLSILDAQNLIDAIQIAINKNEVWN